MTDREQQLRQAVDEAHQVATDKPTQKNMQALKKARRTLDQYLQQADSGDVLRNIPALVDYLDGEGWKISLSTAYEHRDDKKLKLREDGTITIPMALEYAGHYLAKKDGSNTGGSMRQIKEQEEIRRIRADADEREMKVKVRKGELIERSQVEIEFGERATNLKTYLNAVARTSSGRICKIVGGDPKKIPALTRFLLEVNEKAMDNYSRPIKGFEEEDED